MYQRIRDLREDQDLTQKQLSEILHCSQQVYSNYELGQRDIPTQVLIALADFYDTTTDYILGRSSERHPPESANKAEKARQIHCICRAFINFGTCLPDTALTPRFPKKDRAGRC